MKKLIFALLAVVLTVSLLVPVAFAAAPEQVHAETSTGEAVTSVSDIGAKATASAIAIGVASTGGALAMAIAIAKSVEGISRQPDAEDKIRTTLMLGLVFIETAIIYALIITIIIVFVL